MTAHGAQLAAGVIGGAGLPDMLAIQVGHLVGADDPGLWKALAAGLGLGAGEADRGFPWRLRGERGLVDFRRPRVERQAEALEELAAVARAGSKDDGRYFQ